METKQVNAAVVLELTTVKKSDVAQIEKYAHSGKHGHAGFDTPPSEYQVIGWYIDADGTYQTPWVILRNEAGRLVRTDFHAYADGAVRMQLGTDFDYEKHTADVTAFREAMKNEYAQFILR